MSRSAGTPAPLVATLAGLTVASGFLDAISFLGLGHVFVANMTGNVALLGFAVAGAAGLSASGSLVALGFFLAGAVLGGAVARRAGSVRVTVVFALVLEVALVATATVIAAVAAPVSQSGLRYGVVALLALSVGTRNAAVRRLGVPDMTTTVLTTTLTRLASESTLTGRNNPLLRNRVTSVVSMFAGAVVGAVLVIHAGAGWALAAAAALVVAVVATFSRMPRQIGRPSSR